MNFLVIVLLMTALAACTFKQMDVGRLKAAQAEGKIALSTLYTMELTAAAETEHYTSDLVAIGFDPDSFDYFRLGFLNEYPTEKSTLALFGESLIDPARREIAKIAVKKQRKNGIDSIDFDALAREHCPDCVVAKDKFKAMAVANLDGDSTLDIWTIDHQRNLVHLQDDIAK
jgi:hypothetical protein